MGGVIVSVGRIKELRTFLNYLKKETGLGYQASFLTEIPWFEQQSVKYILKIWVFLGIQPPRTRDYIKHKLVMGIIEKSVL